MVLTSATGPILVTGAGGFIGQAVCAHLGHRGFEVRRLVRGLDTVTATRPGTLQVSDLAAMSDSMLAGVLRGAVTVVHLAARVHRMNDAPRDKTADYRRANVELTERIARAAAAMKVGHFVFASSVKVNGEATLPGRPFRESDPPDPRDAYAASKWEAERVLREVAEETGMRVTALRLPLTYGPGVKGNFAGLVRAIAKRRPLPFARIANRRSILGIGNLVSALERLVGDSDERQTARITPYFLADSHAVSTPDLVRAIAEALGVTPRLFAVPPGLLEFAGACAGRTTAVARLTGSLEVDCTAFRERFGWSAPYSLEAGLAALVASPG